MTLRVLRVLARANLGGPARQCAELAREIPAFGIHQMLAVGRTDRSREVEVDLADLAGRGRVLTVEQAEQLGTEASGVVRIPALRSAIDLAGDIESVAGLVRLARRFRPDVIHSHTSKAGLLSAAVARLVRVPLVHTYHGHVLAGYFARPVSRVIAGVETLLNRQRAAVVCVSESCATELFEMGVVAKHRLMVVPPVIRGPNPAITNARQQLGIPDHALAIAFAGRLVDIKDPRLFVAVVERLVPLCRAAGRPLAARVFGSGPLRPSLEQAAESLPIDLVGPEPRFRELLPAFDRLVVTSKREGLPLVAVEALMAGVPVVATSAPGLTDLAGPGVTLVASRCPEQLAEACLAPSSVEHERIAKLVHRHHPRRIAGELAGIYRGLVG